VCAAPRPRSPSRSEVVSADRGSATGTILLSFDPGQARVVLSGEIDVACATQADVACTVVEQVRCSVLVDASCVTFMDVAGLGFLIRLQRASTGWQLLHASEPVLHLLQLTGLTAHLGA